MSAQIDTIGKDFLWQWNVYCVRLEQVTCMGDSHDRGPFCVSSPLVNLFAHFLCILQPFSDDSFLVRHLQFHDCVLRQLRLLAGPNDILDFHSDDKIGFQLFSLFATFPNGACYSANPLGYRFALCRLYNNVSQVVTQFLESCFSA